MPIDQLAQGGHQPPTPDPILISVQTNPMRTHFIADGIAYRDASMTKHARRVLHPADRHYLRKVTNFVDRAWVYFSQIEEDFRLLHMPMAQLTTK